MTRFSGARDTALTGMADDLLRHDERLRDFSVEVRFDLGVAQLSGAVRYPAQLRLLRELLGQIDGVLAVWDRVWVDGHPPLAVDVRKGLDDLCTATTTEHCWPAEAHRVVTDVRGGVPLADHGVDRLYAVHLIEYVADYLPLFDDFHRVLRPGGVLHVMAPYWRHPDAVADPAHVRLLDVQTIKGICLRPPAPRWFPLHVACDGASVFADLVPLEAADPDPDEVWLSRFFD